MREVALITGASSGLGADFARQLAARKHDLFITARRLERLEALREEVEKKHKVKVDIFGADMSGTEGVEAIVGEVRRRNLDVDTLINNAGFGRQAAFIEDPAPSWDRMLQVNVNALVALTRGLLPPMMDRKRGRILNVASVAAFQPVPWFTVYAATKAFVLSFSEGLAKELKNHGIKVSCLCPGPTRTEFAQVAGVDERLAPDMVWMESPRVVAIGLRGLDNGKPVIIPGALNKVQVHGERALPRSLVTHLAGLIYRPGGEE